MFFPQRKLTRDEGIKLERAFWEMIYMSNDNDLALFDFLKLYLRMCTNITDHIPIRPWFDDPDEEEQRGYGYRDDMIALFEQDLYNKITLFKIKVKTIQLILSRIELNFGLILLVTIKAQYLIIFMIMIITMKDLIILFVDGKYFLR